MMEDKNTNHLVEDNRKKQKDAGDECAYGKAVMPPVYPLCFWCFPLLYLVCVSVHERSCVSTMWAWRSSHSLDSLIAVQPTHKPQFTHLQSIKPSTQQFIKLRSLLQPLWTTTCLVLLLLCFLSQSHSIQASLISHAHIKPLSLFCQLFHASASLPGLSSHPP